MALTECVAIGWVYGADRFLDDINAATGTRLPRWLGHLWRFVLPPILAVLLVAALVDYGQPSVDCDYQLPGFAKAIGWMCGLFPLLLVAAPLAQPMVQRVVGRRRVTRTQLPALVPSRT